MNIAAAAITAAKSLEPRRKQAKEVAIRASAGSRAVKNLLGKPVEGTPEPPLKTPSNNQQKYDAPNHAPSRLW